MVSMRQTGPMKQATARRIRRTAELVDHHHPETVTGGHLRDAARMLEYGHTDSAKRHLDAAMEVLTPRNLARHGILDDEGHATAKHHMHEIHRHRLQVQDIEDVSGRNENLRERARQAAAARREGPGRPNGVRPGPPQLQAVHGYSSWGEVDQAIELAFGWRNEPRLPSGEWTTVRGESAKAFHGRMVHGLTGKGEVVTGLYNHNSGKVIVRHSGAVPVVRVKKAAPTIPLPAMKKRYSSLSNEIGLAFPAMAWEHEARDPHGRWSSGPVTLANVRSHMETTHGFGHAFPDRSNEQLLAHHARIHQDNPDLQTHHHMVTGGGADTPYGRMRAARDARELMNAPAFTSAQRKLLTRSQVKSYSSWDEVDRAIELSARTAMLERTPAPRGRPGGPGLYHVSGMGHTPYLQQIVKALIEKRGMPPGKAYAIARGAIRKWMRGGGHVHPEVMAAAGRAEAGELARQARAHAHTADSGASVIELFNPYHAPTGQFTTAQGTGQGQKKDKNAGKGMAGKTPGSRARIAQRAKLETRASSIRSQIRALLAQLPSTHRTSKSKSSTPAKKGAAATSAKQAAQSKAAAASSAAKRASSTTAHKTMSPATIHAKINALRAELRGIEAQIRAL